MVAEDTMQNFGVPVVRAQAQAWYGRVGGSEERKLLTGIQPAGLGLGVGLPYRRALHVSALVFGLLMRSVTRVSSSKVTLQNGRADWGMWSQPSRALALWNTTGNRHQCCHKGMKAGAL